MREKSGSLKAKLKNYTIYFIKEIIPVTVGILIALSIGNWNQKKTDRKYMNEVFSLINNELEATLEDIDWVMPRQEKLMDSLEFYSEDNGISVLQVVKKAGGIHIADVKTNAWRALSSTKMELVDYERLSYLSAIDEQKDVLKMKSQILSNFIYPNLNITDSDGKETLMLMMKDVIGTEKAVRGLIEEFKEI